MRASSRCSATGSGRLQAGSRRDGGRATARQPRDRPDGRVGPDRPTPLGGRLDPDEHALIEEAERLCDTVTIMSHGKAVAVGPPDALIREHAGCNGGNQYGIRPPPGTCTRWPT